MLAAASLFVLLALPAAADAIPIPGPNGKLVFTSGRGGPDNNDNGADIYTFDFPGGPAIQFTNTAAVKDSHPAWSPDRTKVAYSTGDPPNRDIFIKDVITGLITPFAATAGVNEDRAAFSPDGTRIAWTSGLDILVQPVAGGMPTTLTDFAEQADKAAWTPDSQTIYYQRGALGAADIYKEPADNSGTSTVVVNEAGVDEWQPAISPDGTRLCYTRGPMSSAAQVYTVAASGVGVPVNFSNTAAMVGGINCVWSPDGTKIAYTKGVFTSGQLGYQNANTPGPASFVPLSDSPKHFEGNADWARNPSPTCQNTSATVGFNLFAVINLSCSDPAPENDSTSKKIVTGPAHGNIGSIQSGQPAKVIYTPNLNFSGSDTLTFKGNDGTSDSAPATVKITVNPAGGGGGGGGAGTDTVAATISSVAVSPTRWRLGSRLPRYSLAPKGTTIRFRLNEAARVTLTFLKASPGRRVGRTCRAPTRANRTRPRCTRYVSKGSLRRTFFAGPHRVRFQGKLTPTKRLTLGRYHVSIGAVDAAGNRSRTRTASFTIVRR